MIRTDNEKKIETGMGLPRKEELTMGVPRI